MIETLCVIKMEREILHPYLRKKLLGASFCLIQLKKNLRLEKLLRWALANLINILSPSGFTVETVSETAAID